VEWEDGEVYSMGDMIDEIGYRFIFQPQELLFVLEAVIYRFRILGVHASDILEAMMFLSISIHSLSECPSNISPTQKTFVRSGRISSQAHIRPFRIMMSTKILSVNQVFSSLPSFEASIPQKLSHNVKERGASRTWLNDCFNVEARKLDVCANVSSGRINAFKKSIAAILKALSK
jgi:hypothetical protein